MTAARGAHSNDASPASPKENGHPAQPNFPHPSVASPAAADACSTGELTQTWVHFVKTFVLIFPIYVLGYFEFSFSWLLIGLFIFFCWRRNTGGKHTRLSRALAFFDQEEERSAKQGLTTSDLPPWVRKNKPVASVKAAFLATLFLATLSFQENKQSAEQISCGSRGLSCKAAMKAAVLPKQ